MRHHQHKPSEDIEVERSQQNKKCCGYIEESAVLIPSISVAIISCTFIFLLVFFRIYFSYFFTVGFILFFERFVY